MQSTYEEYRVAITSPVSRYHVELVVIAGVDLLQGYDIGDRVWNRPQVVVLEL